MPNEQRHYSNELNLESVGINLPYNMQAEQSVLGAVLLKPDTLTDLVEILKPEMFYTRQNAQIYSEMLRLFTADQTIDFVTLLDAVISDGVFPSADEAKVYLTGLAETVPSISNVKAYAQIVQEKYLVRQLMGVAKDILQDAGDEPEPSYNLLPNELLHLRLSPRSRPLSWRLCLSLQYQNAPDHFQNWTLQYSLLSIRDRLRLHGKSFPNSHDN